jgi:dTMP kinase
MGLERKHVQDPRSDRFEKEGLPFHEQIRLGYLKLAKKDGKRFFVVNGKHDVEQTHVAIRERVERLLEHHGV